jgi:hypothetical protein
MRYFVFLSDPQLPEAVVDTYYKATLVQQGLKKKGYSSSVLELSEDDWVLMRNPKKLRMEIEDGLHSESDG